MRSEYVINEPEWFKNVYNGDWATHMILSTKGKLGYIDEVHSVYRKNIGGMSGSAFDRHEFITNKMTELLNYFNEYSEFRFSDQIISKITELERERKKYKLKKNNKLVFWLLNPGAFFKRLTRNINIISLLTIIVLNLWFIVLIRS
jgi:hypothetical protein